MNPGDLNRKIIIQKCVTHVDEEGYHKEVWEEVASPWAKIKNLHGSVFFNAQAVHSKASCTMTVRYRKELDTTMRILYNNKTYKILYVDDINEAHKYIEIMCEVVM